MKENFKVEEKAQLNLIMLEAGGIHRNVNQMYDTDKPYEYHLRMVADIMDLYVSELNPDYRLYRVLWFACMFHDSIEDARLTYNDVSKIAMKYMSLEDATMATEIVYALTNEKGRTRKERANQKYYQGIRETKYAPFIKACDRAANIGYATSVESSMMSAYIKEMPEFLEHIITDTNPIPKELINKLRGYEILEK